MIFDTQVKLVNPAILNGKATKTQFLQSCQEQAPDVEDVRIAVLHLLKGKKLVGYHILQKLKELKID